MRNLAIILLSCFTFVSFGQNAKSYYKAGLEFTKNGNYNDAIEQFSKTLELQPDYADAYIARAEAFEKLGNVTKAVEDYDRATVFMDNDEEIFYKCGQLYFQLEEYKKAAEKLEIAIRIKSSFLPAYQLLTKTLILDGNISSAKIVSERALDRKNNAENNYVYGFTLYHLGDYVNAEKHFNIAIKKDDRYLDAYHDLAKLKLETGHDNIVLNLCNEGLNIDPNDVRFYLLRSRFYKKSLDLSNAINDVSKAILISPNNEEYYFLRGSYYQDFRQFQNAINDFNKVIMMDPGHMEAYFSRAKMYEEISNYKAAIKDYETILEQSGDDPKTAQMLDGAKKRLFQLNRENKRPTVTLLDPVPKNDLVINVPRETKEISIRGYLEDESEIKSFKINGLEVPFTIEDGNNEFQTSVKISTRESISVVAVDVYDNVLNKEYTINYTETNVPKVRIIAPYASDNGEIYLTSDEPNLYIEGRINDESRIETILVDGIAASFKIDEYNPSFSATINIQNKNKFLVRAIDEHGNETKAEFSFNREGALFSADNPMGKTWVIFIENSDYVNFPSLDGPAKDVSSMRSALANYQIHNFIHKKNLTKSQMERFFNIELRDLVRSNRVNSILIWYAGHGKFINETGYWIPVDAERDDEFSYFNTGNLKASMQMYSRYITHLLLITDACESGSTFYQAMRSLNTERDCNDWKATRFRSSQVFSSAGYELAVDNSQFTKTFANTLANNPDACIPIETIVTKVTEAVVENSQQRPRFGKISGLEDEDGTFFFISK